MIVWTAIEPCVHVAYTDRRCVAIDMDVGLRCHSAFVEVGFVNRISISVLICILAIISCFLFEKHVLKRGLSIDVPSLLLSAPAKYMLILDDWSHKGVLFVDKPSALMAGIISIEHAGGIYLFDIKKWRMYVLHRAPHDAETPSRFFHAIPMLE
ncbi:hypothetical protein SPRG_16482 [Saprolegnia parasitica CBS 223.65]|uniref:Uncharacterized protein n=1 Tax=Saprolegnia parasitica (strain CBS 223.65) TaxID=695850 RepID=A0A067BMM2_SAPPC|nr:hypothetical protein SPRG_16482 [Saprolegnia parasitica CBS 223.65]KDO18000.1 hypothetical protein SPRG_16482 [Saprolegnia parasitica CBS 223.65]|eukprot:XP_012211299.1 hypothetical protein SPRG_16482 [Saprolegnia parasitica CBS 223.65]